MWQHSQCRFVFWVCGACWDISIPLFFVLLVSLVLISWKYVYSHGPYIRKSMSGAPPKHRSAKKQRLCVSMRQAIIALLVGGICWRDPGSVVRKCFFYPPI